MSLRNEERWKRLCEQAAQEQDSNRLMELVEEINSLLAEDTPARAADNAPLPPAKDADAA